jgi:hypothetical protein
MLQMFYEWCAARAKPKPTILEDIRAESDHLYRDTIERQLKLIDDRYKIAANRAKASFLFDQLESGCKGVPTLPDDLK